MWELNSNGFITTFTDNKCLESPNPQTLDILECGLTSDYKDDRERWIFDYDGKIRSSKEQFTCLTLVDGSFGDLVPTSDLTCNASSVQNDNLHNPEKALGDDNNSYWASNPSSKEVIFEVYLQKYPYTLKEVTIRWEFPAKRFLVIGLLSDGFWKAFFNAKDNRQTLTVVNMMNYDILGLKIVMYDSTTKLNDLNIYGIRTLNFHTGGRYVRRESCKSMINNVNQWEIVDIDFTDRVTGKEYKKSWSELHKTRTKFKIM